MLLHRRILLPVESEVQSSPSPPLLNPHNDQHQLHTNVIIAAASAIGAFLFLSLIYYSILRRRRRSLPSNISVIAGGNLTSSLSSSADHPFWHVKTIGLDEITIDSLPSYPHRGVAGGDCHVCLDELVEGEVVRLLPACGHAFHVHCIDTWLRCHLTCPLCRRAVVEPSSAGGDGGSSDAASEDEEEESRVEDEEGESSAMTARSASLDSAAVVMVGGFEEEEEKEGNCSNCSDLGKGGQSGSGRNLWLSRLGKARSSSVLPL